MATPHHGIGALKDAGLDRRSGGVGRAPGRPPARRPQRWWLGLLLAGLLVASMVALSALESTTCTGSAPHALPCLPIPAWVFYSLHAAALLCCIHSVWLAVRELVMLRQRRSSAPPEA
jgi:hypothetical protein